MCTTQPSVLAPVYLSASDLATYAAALAEEQEHCHAETVLLTHHDHAGSAAARRQRKACESRMNELAGKVEDLLRAGYSVRSPGGVADPVGGDEVYVTRPCGRRTRMSAGLAAAFLLDP